MGFLWINASIFIFNNKHISVDSGKVLENSKAKSPFGITRVQDLPASSYKVWPLHAFAFSLFHGLPTHDSSEYCMP